MKISASAELHQLVLQLPHELILDEGVKIQIDYAKYVPIKFFPSNQAGTFTKTLMSKKMLASLQKGNKMSVTVHSSNGKSLVTPVSLLGFSPGFDQLN